MTLETNREDTPIPAPYSNPCCYIYTPLTAHPFVGGAQEGYEGVSKQHLLHCSKHFLLNCAFLPFFLYTFLVYLKHNLRTESWYILWPREKENTKVGITQKQKEKKEETATEKTKWSPDKLS